MHIGSGIRNEWKFEYTASKLAEGAAAQKKFRVERVQWWKDAQRKLMDDIKSSGLEVSESVASSISNYATTALNAPHIQVRHDLQKKLQECHSKIASHQQAVDEYGGWIQVLSANPEQRLALTQADWLYFFGKA